MPGTPEKFVESTTLQKAYFTEIDAPAIPATTKL
jgi:hypothetical protein